MGEGGTVQADLFHMSDYPASHYSLYLVRTVSAMASMLHYNDKLW